MSVKLNIDRLFVYSEKKSLAFYSEFDSDVNIIRGKNTSGKSTVFQFMLYSFGVNDVKSQLQEILEEDVIVRLDCTLEKDGSKETLTVIRDDEMVYIKHGDAPVLVFAGISGNSSYEHIKLKEYINHLMDFNLYLESKNEYKPAPIEVMFLPYYISQSVGWIYLRKSFSSLDYYRNLKNDYLDYYLGIDDYHDRLEKQKLQDIIKQAEEEIKFFINMENNNTDLQVTKNVDEKYIEESIRYVENHKDNHAKINSDEKDYVLNCNKLSYYQQRKSILSRVLKSQKKKEPSNELCSLCLQKIPSTIEGYYSYTQEKNDTEKELSEYKQKIKETQSKINSLKKSIGNTKGEIVDSNRLLNESREQNVTYENWLNNKANSLLIDNITFKIGGLEKKKSDTQTELEKYKSDDEIYKLRNDKNKVFKSLFNSSLSELNVKKLNDPRFNDLYSISAFPSQGVELHKTILAYHFSFNKVLKECGRAHRLPFMLDSIFNEDIEKDNKNLIVKFISENRPLDTQLFISIAETKNKDENTDRYNKEYFDNKAKIITIGNLVSKRSILSAYQDKHDNYLEETLNYIDNID